MVFDTRRNLGPEAWLRIPIKHNRGLDEPEGRAEEESLSAVRKKPAELGVPEGRPSAGR